MANKELMNVLYAIEKLAGLTDGVWDTLSEMFVYDELDFNEWHDAIFRDRLSGKMMFGTNNVMLHRTRLFPTWESMSGKMWFSVRAMKYNGKVEILVTPVPSERISNPDSLLARNTTISYAITHMLNNYDPQDCRLTATHVMFVVNEASKMEREGRVVLDEMIVYDAINLMMFTQYGHRTDTMMMRGINYAFLHNPANVDWTTFENKMWFVITIVADNNLVSAHIVPMNEAKIVGKTIKVKTNIVETISEIIMNYGKQNN